MTVKKTVNQRDCHVADNYAADYVSLVDDSVRHNSDASAKQQMT